MAQAVTEEAMAAVTEEAMVAATAIPTLTVRVRLCFPER